MARHIFGKICYASVATYVQQQCGYVTDDVLLKQTIIHYIYVDDLVVSLKMSEKSPL